MRVLITGGLGFIGFHTSRRFLDRGDEVHVLDNLSRPGTDRNLIKLRQYGDICQHDVDIRDLSAVQRVFSEHGPFEAVLHLAGQVAVTKSIVDPIYDFQANALGTLNLLEAVRLESPRAALVYSSTNKVYGGMEDVQIEETKSRYAYRDLKHGVSEERPLDFHSPYGCSKGAADQYVRDYARIYGLRTVVFRQSCIYGTHQYGIEDQGWVAWFCIAASQGKPLTIYGDGKQVRDLLYVGDLVHAYELAVEQIDRVRGQVFNMGGGPEHTLSLLELVDQLRTKLDRPVPVSFKDWRPGDQRVCIMDTRKAKRDLGWTPQVDVLEGLNKLLNWVKHEYEPLPAMEPRRPVAMSSAKR